MAETFNYIYNLYKMPSQSLFPPAKVQLGGHKHKLFKQLCATSLRKKHTGLAYRTGSYANV
jgi:hypothetical protein